jgi:hypothetical protein
VQGAHMCEELGKVSITSEGTGGGGGGAWETPSQRRNKARQTAAS